MNRKLIIFSIIFISNAGALLLWQKNNASVSSERLGVLPNVNQETEQSMESSSNNDSSFIEKLRNNEYKGGEVKIEETLDKNTSYTGYLISYLSDNLKIYGRMNVPNGTGPFPVIILNHGYYDTSSFKSGDGTQTMADTLARNGYLTFASDYRGHGKSDSDGQRGGHRPEYSIDVMHLLASVKNIDKADASRIGMWGHSMGGEVSMRAIEATDQVKAVALWAPTSANAADNHAFYGGGRNAQPNSTPEIDGTSPINYLNYITAAISIHQGLEDTEVKPEWSKELNGALKKEGKTVEYFEYEGQDHNFKNLGWDLISERTVTFYDKYLK